MTAVLHRCLPRGTGLLNCSLAAPAMDRQLISGLLAASLQVSACEQLPLHNTSQTLSAQHDIQTSCTLSTMHLFNLRSQPCSDVLLLVATNDSSCLLNPTFCLCVGGMQEGWT